MPTTTRQIFHVDDPEVQNAARDAVLAATQSLDATFPGGDRDGVSTNFAGLMEKAVLSLLTGVDPLRTSRTTTHLPVLVYDDHHFGDPSAQGKMFAVIQRGPNRWDETLRRDVMTFKALDDDARRFVPLTDGENINPCTSFTAAVKEAIKWLRHEGLTQEEANLRIRVVDFAPRGEGICFREQAPVDAR